MSVAVPHSGQPASDLIDANRLWRRHMRLAEFGATEAGGVNRQALSAEEIAARAELVAWAGEAGVEVYNDDIGNLFFRLDGSENDAAPVLSGSHIDSQPTGGKFDGAFGVLAALEVVCALAEAERRPRRPIEAVAWMNEEGSRFSPGMMGSEAFTGQKPLERILAVQDRDGTSVSDALEAVLAAEPEVPRRPLGFSVHAYIEAHIEQGPLLERERLPVGVVTGIQGSRRFRVTVTGEAAHAGTAPRDDRKDALLAAARMIDALSEMTATPEDVMFTVGLFQLKPNAPSVVPQEAYFSVDLRHPDNKTLARLGDAIAACCEKHRGRCEVAVEEIANSPSLDFALEVREVIADVASDLGIAHRNIYSAAGHDARQLHYHCPSGMIFIPCRDGISHNESEWAEPDHIAAGTRVLANSLWKLANDS